MLYLSQELGAPVEDQHGARLGKIADVLILEHQVGRNEATYPMALLVSDDEDHSWRIPITELARQDHVWHLLSDPIAFVLSPQQASSPLAPNEISLAHDVLDKQVIDIEQKKAVRVSEVCFTPNWQLLGIDPSPLALVRRLAPAWLPGLKKLPATLVPWHQIELIGPERPVSEEPSLPFHLPEARTPSGQLADLHPADIASIVHQLSVEQGARILERLDDETAADTMEEIDTERQTLILEKIEPERAADILQTMGPDKAADLLAQLPDERQQELLHLMTPQESEEVQDLLAYEPDSAGGLMTTDYIALNQTKNVQDALVAVRNNILEDVRIAYIYCVPDETQDEPLLLGVVSLWDLLVADPTQQLQDLMETDLVTVQPETDSLTVAEIIAKYNLLALPVVSEAGLLQGVVTVDDALDELLPADRRRRPRRMY